MSTALISARIPTHHKATMDELPGKLSEHINLAIASYIESLRAPAKVERIPTAKKNATWKPLSQHTRARMAVLHCFENITKNGFTSSDVGWFLGMPGNNAIKRISELVDEGYLTSTDEYRKSRSSGKMLVVWVRTSKQLPEKLVCR